ncbi:SDR family NAD(P)-dependent oxidoreductase [Sphingobium algorifonticola]|uniref:SDR family oxidoreductase n=1 Tax=Sphingobium algorifonticola TaxID=2008318 RepID=A0A437JDR2_9SPHN|nr:SDR family oxidoreductase [Sphingobium algorifonticola]RVT43820.1 SDR family oxidoreductase [Sphingobium algorifonticola]
MHDFDLTGRRALVTGSTEGIGKAIAQRLVLAGAEVILHGVTADASAALLQQELASTGRPANLVTADFADAAAVDAMISSVGHVDILVSNVAVQIKESLGSIQSTAIDHQVAVNMKAALRLIQAFLPYMQAQKWGRIVMIGSVQESVPHPDMIIYAALKAAQANMVKNIARQTAGEGITVNAIAPGVILTNRNAAVLADPGYAKGVLAGIPARCFGEAEDVAGTALLLCSDAGRYITGTNLPIDGGMHL